MADIWDGGVGGSQVELEGDVEFRDELEQVAFQKVKTFADSARDAEWRRQHRVCVCVLSRDCMICLGSLPTSMCHTRPDRCLSL